MFWKFPSGAQIHFSYFDNYSDVDKIQGKEYSYIGADELGQWENDKVMRYVISRLRSSNGLKTYYRATSNPSRHKWLRTRFNIDAYGNSTKFKEEFDISPTEKGFRTVQYIQAKLTDNPYISKDYITNLMQLPEDDRLALLNGMWNSFDSVDGAIYKKELDKMYNEGRCTNVTFQREFDYYCSFDIGRNDSTSMILYQFIGENEIHIFDHFENTGEDITFYIDWLKNNGYEDAKIILPHDANQHRIETKNSVFETISQSFSNVEVLKKLSIEQGIDCARRKFKNIYFSKDKCGRLLESLAQYRRKHNPSMDIYTEPIHDKSSNNSDSFRYMCLSEKSSTFDYKKMTEDLNDSYTF